MKKILQILFEHKSLPYARAKEVMAELGKGMYNDAEMTAFMSVFLMRTVTIDELRGFRDALLEMAVAVHFDEDVIDIVGTGGDGKNTFNISTLSSFIVAGTGNKVAKHGNYASTSVTGSSNVMEALGYTFKNTNDLLKSELDAANITFLHAPLFHPALKTVSNIRKQLGVRTVFNMLGPLVNPASPAIQVLGVYNNELARMYNYLLQQGETKFAVIHSLDGYDEISLTADTKLISRKGEQILTAFYLGKRSVEPVDILGGNTVKESADIFLRILKGSGTWSQNAVVLANAATALHITGKYESYETAYKTAVASLESGAALSSLQKLIS